MHHNYRTFRDVTEKSIEISGVELEGVGLYEMLMGFYAC